MGSRVVEKHLFEFGAKHHASSGFYFVIDNDQSITRYHLLVNDLPFGWYILYKLPQ